MLTTIIDGSAGLPVSVGVTAPSTTRSITYAGRPWRLVLSVMHAPPPLTPPAADAPQ